MSTVVRKNCPYCGNKEGMEHVACIKCGHVFKDEEVSIGKKSYAYLSNADNAAISEEDVSYLAVKEKEYDPNTATLVKGVVSTFVMLLLVVADLIVQMLLKQACETIYDRVEPLVYVYLGVLLVIPWLFFIPISIAKKNLAAIKDLVHKDKLSTAGKIISIVTLVLSILLLLGSLGLLTYDCIQIIPVIVQSFQTPPPTA